MKLLDESAELGVGRVRLDMEALHEELAVGVSLPLAIAWDELLLAGNIVVELVPDMVVIRPHKAYSSSIYCLVCVAEEGPERGREEVGRGRLNKDAVVVEDEMKTWILVRDDLSRLCCLLV